MLQAVADLDESLLDLRLLHHADQLIDAFQKGLRLIPDDGDGIRHLRAHLGHDLIGDGVAKVLQLLFIFFAACVDLRLGIVQLGFCSSQLGVDDFQQSFVDDVDLGLVQLHLHQFFDQAVGGNAGHTALALDVGHQRVADKIGQPVHIASLAADGHGHERVHVQVVLDDRRRQAAAGQAGCGLVDLVGHLDQRTVHVGALVELHQQKVVVFCRSCRNGLNARYRAQRVFHDVGDFALHALRACTGIDRDHHQIRCADVRQEVRLHFGQSHKAQHQNHDDRNQHRKRLFYTEFFHLSTVSLSVVFLHDPLFFRLCLTPQRNFRVALTFLLYTRTQGAQ